MQQNIINKNSEVSKLCKLNFIERIGKGLNFKHIIFLSSNMALAAAIDGTLVFNRVLVYYFYYCFVENC